MNIISLHIHKSAGLTLLNFLQREFNQKYVVQIEQGFGCDTKIDKMLQRVKPHHTVFHGHIRTNPWFITHPPKKHQWITFIREPLARMASEYLYIHQYSNAYQKIPRWARYFSEQRSMTFKDYCFMPEVQNFISDHFNTDGINDLNQFAFIGVTEYFDAELNSLSKVLNIRNSGRIPPKNKGLNLHPNLAKEVNEVINDEDFKKKFKNFHNIDYQIYDIAIKSREQRLRNQ